MQICISKVTVLMQDSDSTSLKENNESSISANNENENVCKNQNLIYIERDRDSKTSEDQDHHLIQKR